MCVCFRILLEPCNFVCHEVSVFFSYMITHIQTNTSIATYLHTYIHTYIHTYMQWNVTYCHLTGAGPVVKINLQWSHVSLIVRVRPFCVCHTDRRALWAQFVWERANEWVCVCMYLPVCMCVCLCVCVCVCDVTSCSLSLSLSVCVRVCVCVCAIDWAS